MSHVNTTIGEWFRNRVGAVRRFPSRTKERLQRAKQYAGHERDVVSFLTKAAIAAVVAWFLANNLLGWPEATFAPFSAVLLMQSTVYSSVLNSARYTAAMVVGVAVSGVIYLVVGENLGTFTLLMLAGLGIGRWRRLGAQGQQVPTAAAFTYGAIISSGLSMVGQIVWTVLIGAGVGVTVNLFLAPPMRYRTAESGVGALSESMHSLLSDMATGLRESASDPEEERTSDWLYRARRMDETVTKARSAVQQADESVRFNPRRLITRSAAPRFSGYQLTVDALGRGVEQLRSIAAELERAAQGEDHYVPDGEFLRSYARLLDVAAEASRDLGQPAQSEAEAGEQSRGLDRHLQQGWQIYQELARYPGQHHEDTPERWPAYGALIMDAQRLVEEFDRAHRGGAVVPREPGGDGKRSDE